LNTFYRFDFGEEMIRLRMSLAPKLLFVLPSFHGKIQKNETRIRKSCFDYVGGEYDVKYQQKYNVKYV